MDNLQETQRQNRIFWGLNLFILIQALFIIMYLILIEIGGIVMVFNKITIEPSAGTCISDLMPELYHINQKYHCEVIAKFNGKEIIVKPEQE